MGMETDVAARAGELAGDWRSAAGVLPLEKDEVHVQHRSHTLGCFSAQLQASSNAPISGTDGLSAAALARPHHFVSRSGWRRTLCRMLSLRNRLPGGLH